MLRRLARVAPLTAVAGAAIFLGFNVGRLVGVAVIVGILMLAWAVRFGLPRAAHRAFRRGNHPRAQLLYGVLRATSFDSEVRGSLDVSMAACLLGRGDHQQAFEKLSVIDRDQLSEAARAAWHNNRGYALARLGAQPKTAVDDATMAVELRPDLAGFRHTLGIAYLSSGQLDRGILQLDKVWQQDEEPSALLESERCYDLGMAWESKGEHDYAVDYFERAVRAAPQSEWARRSRNQLGSERGLGTLAEYV